MYITVHITFICTYDMIMDYIAKSNVQEKAHLD